VTLEIPYIQVVDEKGRLNASLEPKVSKDQVKTLYETLIRLKTFEARMMNLQRAGRIGFYGGSVGQEATSTGSAFALEPQDWIFPQYREPGAAMIRGMSMETLLYQFMSTARDISKGRQMPVHYGDRAVNFVTISSCVGSQIPLAAGGAWAMRFRRDNAVALVYFGDGATSTQDFHVGMNFAGVFQSPCVFWCNNNQFAISLPRDKQTAAKTLAQKAVAYGIEGIQCDGQDILSVYAAAKRAVDKARRGEGPTFVESITYRLGPHSSSDDPTRYRSQEEAEGWRQKDTLERLRHYLRAKDWYSAEEEDRLQKQADDEVSHAIEAAERAGPPSWQTLLDDVFAEMPPHIELQRQDLEDYLKWKAARTA
jgi:TPP-dependent pyruvate/acetoin dehydrogenase alpha subunit